jgi:hypothetical protein
MNNLKKILGYLMVCIMLGILPTSCEIEDPLDQDPVSSFNEQIIFKDINLTKAFLGHCYMYGGGLNYYYLLSSATDELFDVYASGLLPFTQGTMTPSYLGYWANAFSWLRWDNVYTNIKDVNILLAKIDDVPTESSLEEELKNRIKAEAYFIRAFNYTNLLRSHGGVILIDKPFEFSEDFLTYNRSSLQETRDFILSDIENAINGLTEKGNVEQGRATKGAAAALKVRLLTFCASKLVNGGYEPNNPLVSFQEGSQEDRWKAVRDAAKEIIDGTYGDYCLAGTTQDPPESMTEEMICDYARNYQNIFLQKGEWNDEIIWGVQFNKEQGITILTNLYNGPNGYMCWGHNQPLESFVRSFEMADGTEFIWDKYDIGNDLVREASASELENDPLQNPYNGREPRFYASVFYHGAPWKKRPTGFEDMPDTIQIGYFVEAGADFTDLDARTPGLDSRESTIYPWCGTRTGYNLKKFMDPEVEGIFRKNQEATWTEFRYAEILLDYAEACIELGELQQGLDALNKVRNRAGLPDRVVTSQAEARDFVRHERKIEFFAEGTRWFDIRRWMIADEVIHDVHNINVYEWEDGKMRFEWNMSLIQGSRTWEDKCYWLPISYDEIQRAPQLTQNPGY